jgi:hypothetical protein
MRFTLRPRKEKQVSRLAIEKAKSLLLNLNYHCREIANELGFKSVSHFSHAFKQSVGESPQEYRQHLQNGEIRRDEAAGFPADQVCGRRASLAWPGQPLSGPQPLMRLRRRT